MVSELIPARDLRSMPDALLASTALDVLFRRDSGDILAASLALRAPSTPPERLIVKELALV